jgi:hypothetical protein
MKLREAIKHLFRPHDLQSRTVGDAQPLKEAPGADIASESGVTPVHRQIVSTQVDTRASVSVSEPNRRATRRPERRRSHLPSEGALDGIIISDDFKKVRALLEAATPVVFVTGNAGTGKSTLIQYLRSVLNLRLAVVAPTGVAALNVEGVTIHSLFHLPPKIHEDDDIKLVDDRKLYQKLELLIIDEVSMVRCDLMDSIDKFLRKIRSNALPFGGVQLLLVGDLFQLPPVAPSHEWAVLSAKGYASPYFFSSFSLQRTFLESVELSDVQRQNDPVFVDMLNKLRIADEDDLEFVIAELNRRCYRKDGPQTAITLTCTNSQADQINRTELQKLLYEEFVFIGRVEGEFNIEDDKLPSPLNLTLKVGARVMFTKNDGARRWVNGTLGVVRHVDQTCISVELVSDSPGMVYDVLPATWETYKYGFDAQEDRIVGRIAGLYTQYPLMLAWAATIHKSQGKTLDNILVDLGTGAFAPGQVYVAMSRCRSIDGLLLARPIRWSDVKCDPAVRRFYLALKALKEVAGDKRPPSPHAMSAMEFAPDYGRRIITDGWRPDLQLNFYPFVMFRLAFLGVDRFTTSSCTPIDGVNHALSLDFDRARLDDILGLCPTVSGEVRAWLGSMPRPGSVLQLSTPASFGVEAKLGELQQGKFEQFVPLVVSSVFPC